MRNESDDGGGLSREASLALDGGARSVPEDQRSQLAGGAGGEHVAPVDGSLRGDAVMCRERR